MIDLAKEKKKCAKCSKEISFLETCTLDGAVYCEACFKSVKAEKKALKKGKGKGKAEKPAAEGEEASASEESKEAPVETKAAANPAKEKKTKAIKPKTKSNKKGFSLKSKFSMKWIAAILYLGALYLIYKSIVVTNIQSVDLTVTENVGMLTKNMIVLLEGLVVIILASMVYIMARVNEQLEKNQADLIQKLEHIAQSGIQVSKAPAESLTFADLDAQLNAELENYEKEKVELKGGQEDNFDFVDSGEIEFEDTDDFFEEKENEEIIIIEEDDDF